MSDPLGAPTGPIEHECFELARVGGARSDRRGRVEALVLDRASRRAERVASR